MIIRSLDSNGDWTFGKGKNDYLSNQSAAIQLIGTRLKSFLGDCFFDILGGLNWFSYLGAKDQAILTLAVSSTIINTPDQDGNQIVTGLKQLSVVLNSETRNITIVYDGITIYSSIAGIYTFDLGGG